MSQNRTIVPGMENASASQNDFMYSRGSGSAMGTIVPGMAPQSNGMSSPVFESKAEPVAEQQPRMVAGMPVVGFLYSISNNGVPEYWPIQIGYNRIGRNSDNEVVLSEQTVSGLHASIMVQKKRNGEVISVIRLEQGRTGVLVNEEEIDLRYGSECKNGDIIQVGSNYTFMFILINAEAAGLRVAENFMPVEVVEENVAEDEVLTQINRLSSANNRNMQDRGTIALDGSQSMEAPGGTRFM